MKNIIVPVDFSDTAFKAALFAGNMAEFYGADLLLYHSYEKIIPTSEYGYSAINMSVLQEAAEQELSIFKTRIQAELRRTINIVVKAEYNSLTEGLEQLCDSIEPDLIVMSLSGKNALSRLVVGSNTLKVISELYYPVLVLPHDASFTPVRKIGLACDYKKESPSMPLALLKYMVHDLSAELFVLNVEDVNAAVSTKNGNENICVGPLLDGLKASYQTVISAGVTNGINWFAEKEKIDWVVMVPQKHRLAEKLFTKSRTKDLLLHTKLPVLCMHG
jgi:nucleotide-binding universal stress UspA family protein